MLQCECYSVFKKTDQPVDLLAAATKFRFGEELSFIFLKNEFTWSANSKVFVKITRKSPEFKSDLLFNRLLAVSSLARILLLLLKLITRVAYLYWQLSNAANSRVLLKEFGSYTSPEEHLVSEQIRRTNLNVFRSEENWPVFGTVQTSASGQKFSPVQLFLSFLFLQSVWVQSFGSPSSDSLTS